ncbi:Fanconi anemia group B protein [Acanthopagrus latus]|uniref:Fanconi anemia group B protein n=1 Tax=Acanthopagrus latus TaxID=8177 RepID=UPI00187C59B2|nr:Fanconi anemia group B protein [Acanthopagrus latus]
MESLLSGDSCHTPHCLSLAGKLFIFDSKRASVTHDSERSELVFRRLSFDREANAFLEAAAAADIISGRRSSHVDILKCKYALNVQQRVTTPCVLVSKKSETGEGFQFSLLTLSSSNLLQPCIEFKLSYQIKEDVYILKGPTVLWSHAGDVFYTSLQAGEVRQIPIQLSHSVAGELPLHTEQVFVLGLQNGPKQRLAIKPPSQTQGYFIENGHVFDGTMILPHPYICLTRCMLVLSAEKVDGDGALKCTLVAATSYQQLVYFENGAVKDICQLPFEQPEEIQVVNTGRNGCLFAVSFHQGHVCAVWKETFQIAAQWSDVSSVLVDDFLGCGSDQMLLVFKGRGETGQPLERFLLTDLCGTSYARCQDSEAPKISPPPENYLLTLQALESRLQSGLSVLQELQREVRVKERVLQQSVQALTDVVSEKESTLTQPEQEGLTALWDTDDGSKEEASDDKTRDMPAVSSKPQVDKLWRRIAKDQLVVGVILTIDSSVPVASMSLSILTETGRSSTPAVIQTQSQVFWLPAPCSSSSSSSCSSSSSASTFQEPAAKRSKQHNAGSPSDLNTCRLAVTAVTRLTPLLNSGCVKCCVMLHYVQRQDAFGLVSNPTPAVVHCGQVALNIHSIVQTRLLKNPELKTDEVKEDLLSLMVVLDRWVFHIYCPDHSLGDIDGWIQKRVGCKRIEVSPQYLLLDSSGPSALMLLHWHQITPFQGELSVHSSQLQVLQFLDSLLAYLPASCSIQPVKASRGQGADRILSLALEKEVVSLRECASLLLCDEEEDMERKSLGHEETPEPASVKGLQRCREVWQQDVERSRKRLSPLVDVGRYRRLTQNMSQVLLDGDLAALLKTQTTLPC